MKYQTITQQLVDRYHSIRKAAKESDVGLTTFYNIHTGVTIDPRSSTVEKLRKCLYEGD